MTLLDAIKFFQLGLELTDHNASLDCQSFEVCTCFVSCTIGKLGII